MPGVSGVTVVTMLVCFFVFAHKAAGAFSARHSLRPRISEGGILQQNSRDLRGEIAKLCVRVEHRRCEGQSDEAVHFSTDKAFGLLRFARNDVSMPNVSLAV
jgi:hypothetical protein